jgi:hypothetical protein
MAFRTLGVLAAAETPSAAEQADGLATLNDMLDSWAGERLALFATLRSRYTLTPLLQPHTIGVGGTFDTVRPVRIDRASIATMQGLLVATESPLQILSDAEWQNIPDKTGVGTPTSLWVESSYPLMQLRLLPRPDAAHTLVLYTWQQLGRFASAFVDVDFPPGYARAIRYNLAKEMAPEYGLALGAEAADIANESKSTLKRLNARASYLRCDAAILSASAFNLVTGDR